MLHLSISLLPRHYMGTIPIHLCSQMVYLKWISTVSPQGRNIYYVKLAGNHFLQLSNLWWACLFCYYISLIEYKTATGAATSTLWITCGPLKNWRFSARTTSKWISFLSHLAEENCFITRRICSSKEQEPLLFPSVTPLLGPQVYNLCGFISHSVSIAATPSLLFSEGHGGFFKTLGFDSQKWCLINGQKHRGSPHCCPENPIPSKQQLIMWKATCFVR